MITGIWRILAPIANEVAEAVETVALLARRHEVPVVDPSYLFEGLWGSGLERRPQNTFVGQRLRVRTALQDLLSESWDTVKTMRTWNLNCMANLSRTMGLRVWKMCVLAAMDVIQLGITIIITIILIMGIISSK